MLRTRSHWLVAALIASSVLTAATVSYAQQQPTPSPKGDRMFSRMQRNLGLTDDQVSKIRTIYQQHRDAQHTVWQSLRQAQTELRQLALGGGDPNAIAAKKTQVAQLMAQGMDLRVQTLQEIGPVLTAEQRTKLAQMGPGAMGRRHRGGKPPATQS
jgi:Spy/CpxP family protein refolding chaperone